MQYDAICQAPMFPGPMNPGAALIAKYCETNISANVKVGARYDGKYVKEPNTCAGCPCIKHILKDFMKLFWIYIHSNCILYPYYDKTREIRFGYIMSWGCSCEQHMLQDLGRLCQYLIRVQDLLYTKIQLYFMDLNYNPLHSTIFIPNCKENLQRTKTIDTTYTWD